MDIKNQGNVNANNASKTSRYRPEIDGLRAFAVVAVIINHFNKDILPGGYLGVDIFFVISGYVITSSLFGRPSKDFKDFISGFYERRIKRLVPALSVFVLITSIVICLFNPSPGTSLKTGLTSLFGLSNLYLLKNSTDYFAQSTELNVFTHTWSLGVEEQFYILFPFLIWFSGFGRQTKNGARNLFLIVGALTIASLVGFLYLYPTNQPAAYFLMPSRFWEMAAGCLIFIGFQKRASIEQFLEKVPPLVVLALIIGVMYLPMSLAATSTIAVVALSSILIASLKKQTAAFNIFTHPRVVYIGLTSYSLYLWHWGVLSISRWTIGIHWWSVPFQVALMLGLAITSYRWIETPLRKGNWFGKRWKTLVIGGGVLVTLSGGLVALSKPLKAKIYIGENQNIGLEQSGVKTLVTPHKIKGTAGIWNGKDCVLSSNSQVGREFNIYKCTLGSPDSAKTRILVIGNSYSASFVHAFDELVKNKNFAVTITSSWGASPVPEITNKTPWSKANDYYWSELLPSLISELNSGDIVFAINDLNSFSPKTGKPGKRLKLLNTGIKNLSNELRKKEINLVFMHGIPFAREANCKPEDLYYQWFQKPDNLGKCKMPNREDSLIRRHALDITLSNLSANGYLKVIDLFDLFCPTKECNYYGENNVLLYRDQFSHPSVEAARMSAPRIKKHLKGISAKN